MLQLVDNRSFEHKFVSKISDLKQQLALRIEMLFDIGFRGHHATIVLLADEVPRLWSQQGLFSALSTLKVKQTMRVMLMRNGDNSESVPAQVLMMIEALRMLTRYTIAIRLTTSWIRHLSIQKLFIILLLNFFNTVVFLRIAI